MRKFTIGEVSQITGVSKETLRYYDKLGLLSAERVHTNASYRYYTIHHFWFLDVIQTLRALDVPIAKIKELLGSKDDEVVMNFLRTHKKAALAKSEYYKRVADEIDHYSDLLDEMSEALEQRIGSLSLRTLPTRRVLYAENKEETSLYHIKLRELNFATMKTPHALCRRYGFRIDPTQMAYNKFVKLGEYLVFPKDMTENANQENLTVIPGGLYVCYVTSILYPDECGNIKPLVDWCDKEHITMEYVIADEIGWHLFDYIGKQYICEIKVLIRPSDK